CMDEFPEIKNITVPELKEKILNNEKIQLIDIREKELFKNYHIPGSINYQIEEILDQPELVPKEFDVVLICENGSNSLAVIDFLEESYKYKHVYNLKGGIQEWIKY
ncbi:MAG: rhodanese-like domain-containing protein, partial [Bacteroidota bacterium]